MNNLIWILAGAAAGYIIATQVKSGGSPPAGRTAIPQGYVKQAAAHISDFPRAYKQWPQYINKDSIVEAQMVI